MIGLCIGYFNPNYGGMLQGYATMKLPVVAFRVGSLVEIVEDGKTELLLEMKNSRDMAQKLMSLVKGQELGIVLGKNAQKKCEKEYCKDVHMNGVICILSGVNGVNGGIER